MASYRVLPAVDSGGGAFGSAIGEGISAYADVGRKRRKKEEAEEKRSKFAQAAESSGMELSGLTYDEEGKAKYSYKKKKDPKDDILKDPSKTIRRALMGLEDPEVVGPAFDIKVPEPVQTAHGPIIGAADQDYGQVVQRALKERFAPGVSQEAIARDFTGLPQEKAQKADVPPEFTVDVQSLKKIAQESTGEGADPESIFYEGMQKLSMKYLDNPMVLNRIKLILQTLDQ